MRGLLPLAVKKQAKKFGLIGVVVFLLFIYAVFHHETKPITRSATDDAIRSAAIGSVPSRESHLTANQLSQRGVHGASLHGNAQPTQGRKAQLRRSGVRLEIVQSRQTPTKEKVAVETGSKPRRTDPPPSAALPKTDTRLPETGKLLDEQLAGLVGRIDYAMRSPFTNKTEDFYIDSLRHVGDTTAFEHALLESLLLGRTLQVAAIGGSITAGNGLYVDNPDDVPDVYAVKYTDWLRIAIQSSVTLVNQAIGATGSEYYAYCVHELINLERTHLVLAEFAFNDDRYFYMPGYKEQGRPLEELLRQLVPHKHIHTLLVNFIFLKKLIEVTGANCTTIEDTDFDRLSQVYNLSTVSWKPVACRDKNVDYSKFFSWDGNHPNALVHQQAAEFLVHYTRLVLTRMRKSIEEGGWAYITSLLEYKREIATLLAPVYRTTWIYAPTCWITIKRKVMTKDLFYTSITQMTDAINTAFQISQYSRKESIFGYLLNSTDATITFEVKLPPDRADLDLRFCLVYTLCKSCPVGKLGVTIAGQHVPSGLIGSSDSDSPSPRRAADDDVEISLYSYGYKTNIVRELTFTKPLKYYPYYIIELKKLDDDYFLNLHGLLAAFADKSRRPVASDNVV